LLVKPGGILFHEPQSRRSRKLQKTSIWAQTRPSPHAHLSMIYVDVNVNVNANVGLALWQGGPFRDHRGNAQVARAMDGRTAEGRYGAPAAGPVSRTTSVDMVPLKFWPLYAAHNRKSF
jgi:hypothetical protein